MKYLKQNNTVISLSILLLIYIIIGLSGYGNDLDTYLMIKTGRDIILNEHYYPSRPPGYLIPELVIGGASIYGGYYLSNLISALLGIGSLFIFKQLLDKSFPGLEALMLTLMVGLNPYYVIAASSSMDYLYSIFFGLMGLALLFRKKPYLAALVFSVSVSARLSNVIIIGLIYLYFLYVERNKGNPGSFFNLIKSIGLTVILTAIFFYPAFIAYDKSLGFLTYTIGDWSFHDHLIRFVYKNTALLGLAITIVIIVQILWRLLKTKNKLYLSSASVVALGMIISHELLFFRVPLEISYLLPLLLILLPLYAYLFMPSKLFLLALLILTVIHGFIAAVDVLDIRYNEEQTEAIAADIGLYVRRGIVVKDLMDRSDSMIKYSGYY